MKIVFFGTANVALPILEALRKQHQILAVVTNPDAPAGRSGQLQESPVSALAKDLNLQTFKPEKIKNNPEFLEQLKILDAEIFVVVAYGKILPMEIINLPPLKTVNVHFSALPKYRGPSPIQYALLNGDQQTGSSIFLLDEQVDHGPLLAQTIVNIDPGDNFFTLSDRLAKLSGPLLIETLADYQSGKITPLPQDDAAVSYCKIIAKQDGQINWQHSSQQIYNQFRAFFLWPGVFTKWQGKTLKITDCGVADSKFAQGQKPGTVLGQGVVVCGQGTALEIKSLKLEGKSEVGILDFLNGYRDFVGSQLA